MLTLLCGGELRIHPSGNELPLSLKEDMKDQYIFRQTEKTPMGFVMSQNRISQAAMSGWVKRIGVLLGFERNTISYNLRYMAGNKMDQNGMIVPESSTSQLSLCPHPRAGALLCHIPPPHD